MAEVREVNPDLVLPPGPGVNAQDGEWLGPRVGSRGIEMSS
jgi:hypothetical protein